MTSMIGHSSMLPVVEHSGYGDHLITPWKLDPNTLKLTLKGNIPYPKQLLQPQTKLLRYVLEQPYSRDMVCSMLGLQKMVNIKIFFYIFIYLFYCSICDMNYKVILWFYEILIFKQFWLRIYFVVTSFFFFFDILNDN